MSSRIPVGDEALTGAAAVLVPALRAAGSPAELIDAVLQELADLEHRVRFEHGRYGEQLREVTLLRRQIEGKDEALAYGERSTDYESRRADHAEEVLEAVERSLRAVGQVDPIGRTLSVIERARPRPVKIVA